ncbi:MAG: UDP-N-acetylmuramoyl-L-alanyl-D-glutamate--2,6-diaminopimelate ligase [Methylococcaceae bacterium]
MTGCRAPHSPPTQTLGTLLEEWPLPPVQAEIPVRGLCMDSRRIQRGDVFVALAGRQEHALEYAESAIQQGCAAIIYDPEQCDPTQAAALSGIAYVGIPSLEQHMGRLADRFFDSPSSELAVVGITGTNGKTSCSHFIAQALAQQTPAGVIGTLGWGIPPNLKPTEHTTPTVLEAHRMLRGLRQLGCRTAAIEASSHGLHQGRLDGVRFTGALFTNFTRDHLDYHGDMAAYLDAKLVLLDAPGLKFVVFDADSAFAGAIRAKIPSGIETLAFSRRVEPGSHRQATLSVTDYTQDDTGLGFWAHYRNETAPVRVPLFGDFNGQNALATLGVLISLGQPLASAARTLEHIRPVAGRMERYQQKGRTVVVDYAHTPDALNSVLESIRPMCTGRLWLVFGCGGDRDAGKRPEMGSVAVRLADQIVITDDNPRTEDGGVIVADILKGCSKARAVEVIRDRLTAIHHAINQMRTGDWLVVAGKGHENTQEIGGQKMPFSDREVVQRCLSLMQ